MQKLLTKIIKEHKAVLFDGDNYTEEWKAEAAKRGLPNLVKTPEALATLEDKKTVALFEKYGVFSARETQSRYEVYMHTYHQTVALEGFCGLRMARTLVVPAAIRYLAQIGKAQAALPKGAGASLAQTAKQVAVLVDAVNASAGKLDAAVHAHKSGDTLDALAELRKSVDGLEGLVPAEVWPLPTYSEMLFL